MRLVSAILCLTSESNMQTRALQLFYSPLFSCSRQARDCLLCLQMRGFSFHLYPAFQPKYSQDITIQSHVNYQSHGHHACMNGQYPGNFYAKKSKGREKMKRKKLKFVVSALLSTLVLLTESTGLHLSAAPTENVTAEVETAGQTDDAPEAEEAAGDNVYPARTKGSYCIQASYNGGSRNGQYDKYTISVANVDTNVNINTLRNVQATATYSGNAANSLITGMAHTATTAHAALYQNAGSSNYNYLYATFQLNIPTGYRIADVSYSGQGTRPTMYHLYLNNGNVQFNTTGKTWNSGTANQLTTACAQDGTAQAIGIRSMVDVFYHAGVGTTSANYVNAHGNVTQSVTVSPITYTLVYDANGGTGAPAAQTMTYDTAGALSATVPARTGYLFGGWSIGGVTYNAGQTLTASQVSSFSSAQSATVVATAVWTPISYQVAYDLDGGYGAVSGQSVTYGTNFTLPAAPVKEGYLFAGWQAGGSGACYSAGQSLAAATFSATNGATVTFRAKWNAGKYQVQFYSLPEDASPQTVTYGIDENGTLPAAPVRSGYLFTGWKIEGATYTAGQSVKNLTKTNGDILKALAIWQPICYSIAYDGNGATEGTTANQDDLTYDVPYKLQPNGYKKQYNIRYDLQGGELETSLQTVSAKFVGWSKQDETPLLENNAEVINLTDQNETVILYAVWDDTTLTVCLPTPVKKESSKAAVNEDGEEGYDVTTYQFDAWKLADGTTFSGGQEIAVSSDMELTAQWKEETSFSKDLPEENQTGQIINKLNEIGSKLNNNYNLTQEQAQQILEAIEDGSAFKLTMDKVQYTIVRNADGTLSIKLAAMPEGMEKIKIPSEVKIGDHTYAITEIYKECFRGNKELKEVTIGNHISKIGEAAFAGCTSLEKVHLAEGLITIGERAFDGCSVLKSISTPATLQTIGDCAFRNCASLKTVTLRKGLLTIGNYAFYRCKLLQKANMPDSVIKVGKYAFASCGALKTVKNSKACTTMGEGVFADDTALKRMTLPASLTEVPAKALYNCKKMTSVKMGAKITVIGKQAFMNCQKLTTVTIPKNVMTIKEKAFYKCSSMKKVKIASDHLSAVGKSAFKKCAKGLKFAVPTKKKDAYVKLLKGKY